MSSNPTSQEQELRVRVARLEKEKRVLERALQRSEANRTRLEEFKDKHELLLQKTIAELREAEYEIAAKSRALEKINEELRQSLVALSEARVAAESANAAKSSFLTNMSHELRTPLNAIIGYSEMLAEDMADEGNDKIVPDLEKISNAGKHLLSLINDILDLSKIEAGKMELFIEEIDVASTVREVVDTARPLFDRKSNTLDVRVADGLGTMQADLTKVRQSLFNLLSNAAKFTDGGTIRLDVERLAEPGGDWVVFCVADEGIGMSEEQVQRLFQPFMQAASSIARNYGGTGLGLAITQRVCQMMGGSIAVETAPGKGSTFTIRLPAVSRTPSQAVLFTQAEPPARASIAPEHAPRVLVIDDDPAVRELLLRFLTKEGFAVDTAADGSSGLEMARTLRPMAITLDAMMPGMDGWTVLAALKSNEVTAAIPVVMLTITDNRELGYALGVDEYLTKPVDRKRLIDTLRRLEGDHTRPVLVVDDEPGARSVLRRMLEKEGMKVVEASNGREALDVLESDAPRLVLLDLMMPEMDGFEFVQVVRSREGYARLPIVVITAAELRPEERQQLEKGVQSVLQKSACRRDVLLQHVRRVLADPQPAH